MKGNKQVQKQVLGITAPKDVSDSQYYDKNCPFTGGLVVKKEVLKGKVIKRDTNRSATIEWEKAIFIPKYERYSKRRSRLRVHNPPIIDAQIGQTVLVAKTRPLSKTKHHVIIQVLDNEIVVPGAGEKKPQTKKTTKSTTRSTKSSSEKKVKVKQGENDESS